MGHAATSNKHVRKAQTIWRGVQWAVCFKTSAFFSLPAYWEIRSKPASCILNLMDPEALPLSAFSLPLLLQNLNLFVISSVGLFSAAIMTVPQCAT